MEVRSQPLALNVVPWDAISSGEKVRDDGETQFVMDGVDESAEWRISCLEGWLSNHHASIFKLYVDGSPRPLLPP